MSQSAKLQSIQVLRAFAALGVVTLHAAEAASVSGWNPGLLASRGAAGVDIFFVISGLIIATTLQRRQTAGAFLRRRWLRIAPLYYGLTLPAVAWQAVTRRLAVGSLVASFAFWPALATMNTPIVGVGWTLCFEMLFYVCAAFTLTALRWAGLALVVAFIACVRLAPLAPAFQFLGNPMIGEFLLGVLIARATPPTVRLAVPLLVLGLAGLLLFATRELTDPLTTLTGQVAWARLVHLGLPAAALVYGVTAFEAAPWPPRLVYLGDASYSLYLSHLPVIGIAAILAPRLGGWPTFAVGVLGAIGFAVLVYRRVELPLGALCRRFAGSSHALSMPAHAE